MIIDLTVSIYKYITLQRLVMITSAHYDNIALLLLFAIGYSVLTAKTTQYQLLAMKTSRKFSRQNWLIAHVPTSIVRTYVYVFVKSLI